MTDKEKIRKEVARLYRESYDNAPTVLHQLMDFINSLPEEPVNEDLEEAAENAIEDLEQKLTNVTLDEVVRNWLRCMFRAGALWQKEVFEKNRLAHCDAQTEEEAEIEQSFVMGIIENEHRQPTFDDAIKYGMRLQKKKMMEEAITVRSALPSIRPASVRSKWWTNIRKWSWS